MSEKTETPATPAAQHGEDAPTGLPGLPATIPVETEATPPATPAERKAQTAFDRAWRAAHHDNSRWDALEAQAQALRARGHVNVPGPGLLALPTGGSTLPGGKTPAGDPESDQTKRLPGLYIPPEEEERLRDLPSPGEQIKFPLMPEEIEEFLMHYAETGAWNQSAYQIGRSGAKMHRYEKENPGFRAMVGEAVQNYREKIAGVVRDRALNGMMKPVFGKDGIIGYTVEYSDRLLELEARAAWPERYSERAGPALPTDVKFGVLVVPGVMATAEQWEELHGSSAKGLPAPSEPSDPAGGTLDDQRVPRPKVTRPVVQGRRGPNER